MFLLGLWLAFLLGLMSVKVLAEVLKGQVLATALATAMAPVWEPAMSREPAMSSGLEWEPGLEVRWEQQPRHSQDCAI